MLLEKGARIDVQDANGDSAVVLAERKYSQEIARILSEKRKEREEERTREKGEASEWKEEREM